MCHIVNVPQAVYEIFNTVSVCLHFCPYCGIKHGIFLVPLLNLRNELKLCNSARTLICKPQGHFCLPLPISRLSLDPGIQTQYLISTQSGKTLPLPHLSLCVFGLQ